METESVLATLEEHGCVFDVVGSTERWLCSGLEDGRRPRDLDIVAPADGPNRDALWHALSSLDAQRRDSDGLLRPLLAAHAMPRQSWHVESPCGPIDVFFESANDTQGPTNDHVVL